jgi:hypothetical protein
LDVEHIEQLPLFAGLDKRERARVAQHADEVDVPGGNRPAVEGDLAYELFVSMKVGGLSTAVRGASPGLIA